MSNYSARAPSSKLGSVEEAGSQGLFSANPVLRDASWESALSRIRCLHRHGHHHPNVGYLYSPVGSQDTAGGRTEVFPPTHWERRMSGLLWLTTLALPTSVSMKTIIVLFPLEGRGSTVPGKHFQSQKNQEPVKMTSGGTLTHLVASKSSGGA